MVTEDKKVDAVVTGVFISTLLKGDLDIGWLKEIGKKPILFMFKDDLEPFRVAKMRVETTGFPVYPTPERAVKTIKYMLQFNKFL